jgi:hypothetical protein
MTYQATMPIIQTISPAAATDMFNLGHQPFCDLAIDVAHGCVSRSRTHPAFISRSCVMNCCGLSQIFGALYPMERAMSATKALQL